MYVVNAVTDCCNTRSWSIIQGKETNKNIIGNCFHNRAITKKHPICVNKRCKNYLKSTKLKPASGGTV